jgi:hypothetical protein
MVLSSSLGATLSLSLESLLRLSGMLVMQFLTTPLLCEMTNTH